MKKSRHHKVRLRLKLLLVFILTGFLYVGANGYSQTSRVSITLKNASLKEVFQELEKKTDFVFLYKHEVIKDKGSINIDANNKLLTQILYDILIPVGLNYSIDDNVIVISASTESKHLLQQTKLASNTISGTVRDSNGESLPGASVVIKGTIIGTSTDMDGKYKLEIPAEIKEPIIVFSFLGMETSEVKYTGQKNIDIVLKEGATLLKGVVVEAGIMQRNKLGFTGSFKSVTAEELKSIGNTNVLQSLKTIDPSFVITDNAIFGSDPNTMANIQIRGQNTIDVAATRERTATQANTPLFILDGFESTIQEINDIDINRIETIVILKDAGSTAIYGAKGANGVIVVETIKPKRGEIMITYNSDLKLSFADLTSYNMMNASEKLEFERLAGRYDVFSGVRPYSEKYYDRLALIGQGVDTYWLSEPIRAAFTHSHSLNISGGDKSLLFDVGVNYKNQEGVMKDSKRETYGANFKINYRGLKKFNISNSTYVSGTNAHDGAWTTGNSFQDFVNANPYFRKRISDGSIPILLDEEYENTNSGQVESDSYNPLYNATLNSYQANRYFYFTNNTSIDWRLNDDLRISSTLSLKRTIRDYDKFIDPRNTTYINYVYTKKGAFTSQNENEWSVKGRLNLGYTKTLGKGHNLTTTLVGSLEKTNSRMKGFEAEGFPLGAEGKLPSTAYGFKEGGVPSAWDNEYRAVTGIFAFNYNYQFRYLFDFSINEDGSTAFGRNKKFQEFWSVGLGWNVDREKFASNWNWLSRLKISGTIGTNGNQTTNAISSSVYSFYTGNSYFGQGAYLDQLGNPDLDWEQITKAAITVDASMFNERLTFNLGYYSSKTDPMVILVPQKPSSGARYYPMNLGYMENNGIDFSLLYYPIYNKKENIMLGVRINGSHNKNKYGGISDALQQENNMFESDPYSLQSLTKYQDGYSSTSIWAVKSLGIDPASGRELFEKKDGTQTFDYDINDRIKVGDVEPVIKGVVGLNIYYKKLEANFSFRYSLGGDMLNTDLYNKVENVTRLNLIYNKDKRALYDRWKEPGDITEFSSIKIKANGQPLSSRYVQRNNYITGESVKISWDFSRDQWIKHLRLKSLKIGFSMNDIFRMSSIKTERSTNYPFERAVLFNLMSRF